MRVIGSALREQMTSLRPENRDGRRFAGWADLLGSESLQLYSLEALASAPQSSADAQLQQSVERLPQGAEPFLTFLGLAAQAGRLSEARLSALVTHKAILATLREAAQGRVDELALGAGS